MFQSMLWGGPFLGLILSIAFVPLLSGKFWHAHYGKIAAIWAISLMLPMLIQKGQGPLGDLLLHALGGEYFPFMALILALYVVASGVRLQVSQMASPALNTAFLGMSAVLASCIGTTGASMILIRPFLEMNQARNIRRHQVIFFIFLVANIGGALTPVGDPPLFLGFLNGVKFFWTTQYLFLPFLTATVPLLAGFYLLDRSLYLRDFKRRGEEPLILPRLLDYRLRVEGAENLAWLGVIVVLVIISGIWRAPLIEAHQVTILSWGDVVRNIGLLAVAWISWRRSSPVVRIENRFDWFPMMEVAKLFAAIFITVYPLIEMLKAGKGGVFKDLLAWMMPEGEPNNSLFFWITGGLSAFLDNAPTYLVFFNAAGGDASVLMTSLAKTLEAISLGAVFMGAMTYIGNAPNFMVKSIAEEEGVKMPSFFGYMAWSALGLLPVFFLINFLFL